MIHIRQRYILSRCRQRIKAAQLERQALEAELMNPEPLVEGCLVTVRTVCGKPACRCRRAKRFRHGPYLHLSLLRDGKTKMLHLPKEWEEEARAGVEAARRLRKARIRWRILQREMENLWRQVELNRRSVPYEPKKKSR